jgi:hypothetical protein
MHSAAFVVRRNIKKSVSIGSLNQAHSSNIILRHAPHCSIRWHNSALPQTYPILLARLRPYSLNGNTTLSLKLLGRIAQSYVARRFFFTGDFSCANSGRRFLGTTFLP